MQDIEPHYIWKHLYSADEDELSPFYETVYSEFEYTNQVYNYLLHPQWDDIGSQTLYLKVLYTDYTNGFTVIEFIGEWNDCINNDIMILKRELIETMIDEGVNKFILLGEHLLNFHGSGNDYYEEWFQEIEDGWIAAINFREHVLDEIKQNQIDYYLNFGGELDNLNWRKLSPVQLFQKVSHVMSRRLV